MPIASLPPRPTRDAGLTIPLHLQRLEAVKMIGVAILRRIGYAQPGQAGKEDWQDRRQFESRQRRADAKVNAPAKAHMGIGRPPAVEGVGHWEPLGIAVGGAEQEADLFAFPQAYAGDLGILQSVAIEEMQRRVEPQQFLDRGGGVR